MSAHGGRVWVVGSANMDLIVRAPSLPRAGETLMGGPFATAPGGKGANQAVAAARMGAPVTMIGRVGDDAHAKILREALGGEGIDVVHLRATAGEATGVALITVDARGENTIVVAPGANARVTRVDTGPLVKAKPGDVALFQLEVPIETIAHAASLAREHGATTILNAAPAAELPPELLASIDVLIVNETEAGVALGEPDPNALPDRVVQALRARGPALVIMTLGASGALAADSGGIHVIPAARATPVDTVGAGDAFCGVLAASIAEGVETFEACLRAAAAGALATETRGAIPSLPRREDVLALTDTLRT